MFDDINNDNNSQGESRTDANPAAPTPSASAGKQPAGLGPQDALELAKAGIKKQDTGQEKEMARRPGAIEDIFANTEDAPTGAPAGPSTPGRALPFLEPDASSPDKGQPNGSAKKIILLTAVVIVVASLGYAGYWLYNNSISVPGMAPDTAETTVNDESADTAPIIPVAEIEASQELVADSPIPAPDTDQDGLSDEEEEQLGTNPATVDSDNDGLFDREEVKVYGTDPLNPDTDGDGYLDGDEVSGNYNPLGPGALYQVERE